jgi:hypothetical protein
MYTTSLSERLSRLSPMEFYLRGNFMIFYKENPWSNEEFKHTVEKMIATEEKTRKCY